MLKRTLTLCLALIAISSPAFCQISTDFGPNAGSDGDFAPTDNTQINLGSAPTAAWDSAGTGNGVYDPQKWAVVFKYKSVTVGQYSNVTFINNPSTAPVVWLVSGNVVINGNVNVSGRSSATPGTNALPGPGGFRGGTGPQPGRTSGGGFGVGGGNNSISNTDDAFAGGSYATPGAVTGALPAGQAYGNPQILPLIGGAGGSGRSGYSGNDGGAGGGAILIVATGTVTINGTVYANGGDSSAAAGGGSGGAIRIVASALAGTGVLRAVGGTGYASAAGGYGRIRIEAPTANTSIATAGDYTDALPDSPVKIWPENTIPTVRVVSVGQAAVPTDPHASLGAADLQFNITSPQTVTLATTNVPSTGTVTLRVVPQYGLAFSVPATFVSDDGTTATWTAQVTFPSNYCALQARATVSAATGRAIGPSRTAPRGPAADFMAPVTGASARLPLPTPLGRPVQGSAARAPLPLPFVTPSASPAKVP